MKKTLLPALLLALTAGLTSCGGSSSSLLSSGTSALSSLVGGASSSTSTTTSTTTSTSSSVIGNLLSGLLSSSSTLTQDAIVGTWTYQNPDCVFQSDNLLAKAGGAVAATKVENELSTQLAKVGIKQGACTFTFNSDNTYSAKIGSKSISGSYTLDAKNKKIKLTYLGGLASATPYITKSGSKLSLTFEADKLLTLMQGVSAISGNSNLKTISSLLSNYDGLLVGLQMSK